MTTLDTYNLERLQEVELEILIEIDRICRKNGIRYSLTGGTLLGAVRHDGFIPWDDDADISMMRDEYQRFRQACARELDSTRFYFQDIENTEGYRWGYGKVRRKNSMFLRKDQEDMPYEQGVFVDVFPRDGIPNGAVSSRVHRCLCFLLRKMMWSAIGRRTATSVFERCIYHFMFSTFSREKIISYYRRLINWSNASNTKLVRALTFPLPGKVKGYERRWYQDYVEISFNGYNFMVEAGYREWLEREFGDYMELPPLEQRKTHPVTKIELPL